MVEIKGLSLTFIIGEGPKNKKGCLHRMKIKSATRVYSLEVSNIGSKTMLQKLFFLRMVKQCNSEMSKG